MHRTSTLTGLKDEGAALCRDCKEREIRHRDPFRDIVCSYCRRPFQTHCRAAAIPTGPLRCGDCAHQQARCSSCDESLTGFGSLS